MVEMLVMVTQVELSMHCIICSLCQLCYQISVSGQISCTSWHTVRLGSTAIAAAATVVVRGPDVILCTYLATCITWSG